MSRTAFVYFHGVLAGLLTETETGYNFSYEKNYAAKPTARPVSKTLPLKKIVFESKVLFPFFDGLIPEGWLLDIALDNWKLNGRDRFGLLLACCKSSIGAVSITEKKDEEL